MSSSCVPSLTPSTSIAKRCLIQSVSSLHSTCSNHHLHLTVLIIRLTICNPNSSLYFSFCQTKHTSIWSRSFQFYQLYLILHFHPQCLVTTRQTYSSHNMYHTTFLVTVVSANVNWFSMILGTQYTLINLQHDRFMIYPPHLCTVATLPWTQLTCTMITFINQSYTLPLHSLKRQPVYLYN